MISVVINENFKLVLESAMETYHPKGLSNDVVVGLHKKLSLGESLNINECLNLCCLIPDVINESLDEASENAAITNPHIVKEKKGSGVSVTVQGKEYRYVSPDKPTSELYRSFMGMYKYANQGYKALNWLKKNALCYYGCKNPEGKDLVESLISSGKSLNEANSLESNELEKYVIEFNGKTYRTHHNPITGKAIYKDLCPATENIDPDEFLYGWCMVEFEHTTHPTADIMQYVRYEIDINVIVGIIVKAHLLDNPKYYSALDVLRYATGETKAE